MGASMIRDLAAAIIQDGKVPSDWEQSFIVCLYKGKGMHWKGETTQSQADRAGHESPGEDWGRPHQTVGVNRQFPVWLHPRQRHNRCNLCYQAAAREVFCYQQETLHGFCSPAFDRVPRKVIWWALRKLGVEEWIVRLVQGMYANAGSHFCIGEG